MLGAPLVDTRHTTPEQEGATQLKEIEAKHAAVRNFTYPNDRVLIKADNVFSIALEYALLCHNKHITCCSLLPAALSKLARPILKLF
jgi:hypothetical protein